MGRAQLNFHLCHKLPWAALLSFEMVKPWFCVFIKCPVKWDFESLVGLNLLITNCYNLIISVQCGVLNTSGMLSGKVAKSGSREKP